MNVQGDFGNERPRVDEGSNNDLRGEKMIMYNDSSVAFRRRSAIKAMILVLVPLFCLLRGERATGGPGTKTE